MAKNTKISLPLILGEHVRVPFSTSRHQPVCDASSGIFKALAMFQQILDLDEIRIKTLTGTGGVHRYLGLD